MIDRNTVCQMVRDNGLVPLWARFDLKIKEIPKLHRPAYAVFVRLAGQTRGKHVVTLIEHDYLKG